MVADVNKVAGTSRDAVIFPQPTVKSHGPLRPLCIGLNDVRAPGTSDIVVCHRRAANWPRRRRSPQRARFIASRVPQCVSRHCQRYTTACIAIYITFSFPHGFFVFYFSRISEVLPVLFSVARSLKLPLTTPFELIVDNK